MAAERTYRLSDLWSSCDYTPTGERLAPIGAVLADRVAELLDSGAAVADIGAGHGQLSQLLRDRQLQVTAVEPSPRLFEEGRERVGDGVTWRHASAEKTGLEAASQDAIVSSFGAMYAAPPPAMKEMARILRPGGVFMMTAWAAHGFVYDENHAMLSLLPDMRGATHLHWGKPGWALPMLREQFGSVEASELTIPWEFDSVEDGMRLCFHGSPQHFGWLRLAGDRGDEFVDIVRAHLRSHEEPDGRVVAEAAYVLYTAHL